MVIGDSFWDPHWTFQGCEAYSHAPRKSKEPNSQLLEPLGPHCVPLNPSLSRIVRGQGRMSLTLQILAKSLCLDSFMLLYVSFPPCSPTWGGEVSTPSADRWSHRRRKRKGRQRELTHKLWPSIATGFYTFLLFSRPGSCARYAVSLIPIIRVEMSEVHTPDSENVSRGGTAAPRPPQGPPSLF